MTPDDLFARAYDFTRGHEGGFVILFLLVRQ